MENYFVYRFLNSDEDVVYVGKTRNSLEKRMSVHFGNSGHLSKEQLDTVATIEYLDFDSRVEMDIAELYYINKWKPPFNTQSKYDEEFSMEPRVDDQWKPFDFKIKEDDHKDTNSRVRVEIVLSGSDKDILDYLNENVEPRATQFKNAMRAYMKGKTVDGEEIEGRIRRVMTETLREVSSVDLGFKRAFELERAEKERLAAELELLRSSLRRLAV